MKLIEPRRGAFYVLKNGGWCFPNIHLGVSCEDQATADERIPLLLQTSAAVRFISAEPLLGPIWIGGDSEIGPLSYLVRHTIMDDQVTPRIDWVICGGESGPGGRPMHPDWARSLRDQCARAGVPFFFKQWGEWIPSNDYAGATRNDWGEFGPPTAPQPMRRVGKKAAGSLLDGVEWKQFPREREPVGEAR